MQPIRNNILFKPFELDGVSAGGIIVPDSFKQTSNKGEVIAVGNKVNNYKAGDIGFRVKDWGTEILISGEKYFLMEETAIIALEE